MFEKHGHFNVGHGQNMSSLIWQWS